ncbi:DUF3352 domain-containing protein [Carboxylicivirga marina]|uniref:DUF3352 domain-containing protein n=1 Tax=Carboxylicivirga marina TaxID=2800988 RepID=A0ABS1HEY2_9BACT|nr:DUF3352 domain-containing protein [Carboxylicivirga marina]MBK3516234.1 DUF3352 domain-containing protein [Carboxylicivirga marina]
MKRGWVLVTVFVSCTLLVYIGILVNRGKSYDNNHSLAAIPSDLAVIVKAQSIGQLRNSLIEAVDFKKEIKQFSFIENGLKVLQSLDSVLTDDDVNAMELLNDLPLYFSLHAQGKERVSPLIMFEIPNRKKELSIERFINYLPEIGYEVTSRKYNSKSIFEITFQGDVFYGHINKGLLLLSSSNLLIESSIRQQQRDEKWTDNDEFKQIYKTIGSGSRLNVFVNFSQLPNVVKPLVAKLSKNKVTALKEQSYWAEIDVDIDQESILMNGFMSANNKGITSQLLRNSHAQRSHMHDVLPRNTRSYIALTLESGDELKRRIEHYHEVNEDGGDFDRKIKSVNNQFGFNPKDEFFNVLSGELALAYYDYNHLQADANGMLVLKLKSQSTGRELILEMLRKVQKQGSSSMVYKKYQPDNEVSYSIYKGFPDNLMSHFFEPLFPKVPQKYIGFYEDNIIMADASVLIEQFIYSNMLSKTLSKSRTHQSFLSNFSSRENLFMFCETAHLSTLLGSFFEPLLKDITDNQKEALSNFYGLGVQMSGTGDMIYTTGFLQYLPARESEPRTIWQSLLDSTVSHKPILVKNHYTKEREVLVQDDANNLYLLSNGGRVLWKKPLDSKVKGEIVQVDYYRNNKLQYLFNTRNSIFLLDRNGNNVANFPVKLPSKASNGMVVFDYDKNRKYRIFIACENRRVYLYDGQGNVINGWKFGKTDGTVTLPVQHFRSNGKDYIAFADDKRNYICDRKGNIRVKLKKQFVRNENSPYFIENKDNANDCLVTSDNNGLLSKIHLATGAVTQSDNFDIELDHALKVFTMNGEKHYLITENNRIICFNSKMKEVFDKEFDDEINLDVDLYQFSAQNTKFGVSEKNGGDIFLLNKDGKVYKGFPLKGNSRFSIGFLKSSASRFNLIVGGSENYIYNYQVE